MVTGVEDETAVVVMVKYGEVFAPAATVTLLGTEATAGFELTSDTTTPLAPAGPVSVTLLLVVETPPFTLEGDRVSEDRAGSLTVRVAGLLTPA
jgi:hypothetical protein